MTDRVRLTVLADNEVCRPGLTAEHGLSVLVETGGGVVLFDTGQGRGLAGNAEALGVNLGQVHAIVVSHGHYDHTGGLATVLEQNPPARLFLHPAAVKPKFAKSGAPPHREIGMPESCRKAVFAAGERVVWNREPAEIVPGVHVTGEIPRDAPPAAGRFFLDEECRRPDPFVDEQALWIETAEGLIVLTGCAHAGLPATLDDCRRLSGGRPVAAVFGGFHLSNATNEELEAAAEALERAGAQVIGACHCTGGRGRDFLRRRISGQILDAGCGARWEWP